MTAGLEGHVHRSPLRRFRAGRKSVALGVKAAVDVMPATGQYPAVTYYDRTHHRVGIHVSLPFPGQVQCHAHIFDVLVAPHKQKSLSTVSIRTQGSGDVRSS